MDPEVARRPSLLRRWIPGVSWQHPLVNAGAHALDPLDWLVRLARGCSGFPPYSARIRSNGLRGQFGGGRFRREGQRLRALLTEHAGLTRTSRVLEIGCGSGRSAHALAGFLEHGAYTGMDVEPVALAACQRSRRLCANGFHFERMDVFNQEYNPHGSVPAAAYRFPRADASFDLVFLVSVFTHMLPADVAHYSREICRLLRPCGRCLLSAFLLDHGRAGRNLRFPHRQGPVAYEREDLREIAVAYESAFLIEGFRAHGAQLSGAPHLGTWRTGPPAPTIAFGQDVLVFERGESPATPALEPPAALPRGRAPAPPRGSSFTDL